MSLFIKINQAGKPGRILNFRGLSVQIGLNSHGIVSTSELQTVFFAVHSMGDKYILAPEAPGLLINDRPAAPHSPAVITASIIVKISNLSFCFFPTSSLSEVLGRSNQLDIENLPEAVESVFPVLLLSLAGLSRRFPLPKDIPLSIGSSPADAIQIDYKGIEESQYSILNNGLEVILSCREGAVRIPGSENKTQKVIIRSATEVELIPSGILVKIKPY